MKLVIFGSRDAYPSPEQISAALRLFDAPDGSTMKEHKVTEVVCGEARGADACGKEWAYIHDIPVKKFAAKWERSSGSYNPRAGHERNRVMAEYADIGLGFWKAESGGTANMTTQLVVLNKPVRVIRV